MTIECDESTDPSNTGSTTATDNCTADVTDITHSDNIIPSGDCDGNYTIERTWTAVDECGNIATCVQTITVEDTTPPSFTFEPSDVTIFCGDDQSPINTGMPQADDNCSGAIIDYTDDIFEGNCKGEAIITRTWTVEDECGNVGQSFDQVISVRCTSCVDLLKEVVSEPIPTGNPFEYEITYRLSVKNNGIFAYDYDMVDELLFGDGISVTGAAVSYENGDGQSGTYLGLSGNTVLVSVGEQILPMRSDSFLITVTFDVDPVNITAEEGDCDLNTGSPDRTGLLNSAVYVDLTITVRDSACTTFLGEIGDYVWFDLDKDGIQDTWENGINGLTVYLYDMNNRLVATTKTKRDPYSPSGDGYYNFCVAPGTYYLKFQKIFSLSPSPALRGNDPNKDSNITGQFGVNTTGEFTVVSGQARLDLDAGFVYGYTVTGTVWNDANRNGEPELNERAVADVVIEIHNAEGELVRKVKTDATGHYGIEGLSEGQFQVHAFVPDGFVNVPLESIDMHLMDGFEPSVDGIDIEALLAKGRPIEVNFGLVEMQDELNGPTVIGLTRDHEVKLFPNPVEDDLFVNFRSFDEKAAEIHVFDIRGKQVLYVQLDELENNSMIQHRIDMRLLSPAVYVVMIKLGDTYYDQQIVVGK